MLDLNEFAKEVHQNAIDHGFWDDDATDERQIALIHSEWSEALQADRSGCTPREVCMELIDGVLRVLDYCAAYNAEVSAAVVFLHVATSKLYVSGFSKVSKIVSCVFAFVRTHGFDPYVLMHEKHQYNLTRPPKHGKRY